MPSYNRLQVFARPSPPTFFVVSFVLAMNKVNVVAVTTILVLHVGVIGQSFFVFNDTVQVQTDSTILELAKDLQKQIE